MGTRAASSSRAKSKAERAAVTEVLEGKSAAAFSKGASVGAEEKIKNPKPKKDGLRLSTCSFLYADLAERMGLAWQELSMEDKKKKDFQKDHAAYLGWLPYTSLLAVIALSNSGFEPWATKHAMPLRKSRSGRLGARRLNWSCATNPTTISLPLTSTRAGGAGEPLQD